jgi:hypothetical protein
MQSGRAAQSLLLMALFDSLAGVLVEWLFVIQCAESAPLILL